MNRGNPTVKAPNLSDLLGSIYVKEGFELLPRGWASQRSASISFVRSVEEAVWTMAQSWQKGSRFDPVATAGTRCREANSRNRADPRSESISL